MKRHNQYCNKKCNRDNVTDKTIMWNRSALPFSKYILSWFSVYVHFIIWWNKIKHYSKTTQYMFYFFLNSQNLWNILCKNGYKKSITMLRLLTKIKNFTILKFSSWVGYSDIVIKFYWTYVLCPCFVDFNYNLNCIIIKIIILRDAVPLYRKIVLFIKIWNDFSNHIIYY